MMCALAALNRRYIIIPLVWFALHLLLLPSMAAEPGTPISGHASSGEPTAINPPPSSSAAGSYFTYLTSQEFVLSLLVLLFGVAALGFEYALMRDKAVNSADILKVVAVTLIVVSTLFVITAGFSSQQIAPAMGLFGTIAGYLLGRSALGEGEKKDG